jgi:hypothetical protein
VSLPLDLIPTRLLHLSPPPALKTPRDTNPHHPPATARLTIDGSRPIELCRLCLLATLEAFLVDLGEGDTTPTAFRVEPIA